MRSAGFGKEVDEVAFGRCPFCRTIVNMTDFKDDLSLREFQISGLCNSCQDSVFNDEVEDEVDEDDPYMGRHNN